MFQLPLPVFFTEIAETLLIILNSSLSPLPRTGSSGKPQGHGLIMASVIGLNGKLCLPRVLFLTYAKLSHSRDHMGKGEICNSVNAHWYMQCFSMFAQQFRQKCMQKCIYATAPGQLQFHWSNTVLRSLSLTDHSMFSKWVECYPTSNTDAVAKVLLCEIIPQCGICPKLSSDNGQGTHRIVMMQCWNIVPNFKLLHQPCIHRWRLHCQHQWLRPSIAFSLETGKW